MNLRYVTPFLLATVLPCLAGTINIQPSTQTFAPGQTFSVNVNATSVSDLFGYQFDLAFNPAVISAISVTEGSFLAGGGSTIFIPGAIDNVGGTIAFNADRLVGAIPGVTGSGTLASVQFKALATGTSTVNLANVTLLNSSLANITAGTSNGSVTVQRLSGVPEPATWTMLLLTLPLIAGSKKLCKA